MKPWGLPNFTNVPANGYIALDVYQTYFFWPSWSQDEPDSREYVVTDSAEPVDSGEIFSFVWPADVGEAYGLCFWGITTADTGDEELIVGPIARLEFGYSQQQP
ncbi:hypothetical protein ACFL0Z_02665 [Patescibacteria group bacterium]